MSDRRSHRIRQNFKQQANPRSRNAPEAASWSEQMRRTYQAPEPQSSASWDHRAELARLLVQRKGRR
jgi:maltose-binding protein MalE